ncbi:hypothetical protein [Sulfuricaulis sp.]|jgi:hypothetical protein|uniref:hypothetical protein n=1 Tax=Sulfuricaulis sp. TaxID=2003553 RepID=UPI00355978F0
MIEVAEKNHFDSLICRNSIELSRAGTSVRGRGQPRAQEKIAQELTFAAVVRMGATFHGFVR